jgi:uncharacterized protein
MSDTETVLARNISRDQLLAELRALRPAFEREGVTHMTLFGSRARGDYRSDSDVDLAIDVDPRRKFSLIDLSRLHLLGEDRLRLNVSVVLTRGLRPSLKMALARDGVPVF